MAAAPPPATVAATTATMAEVSEVGCGRLFTAGLTRAFGVTALDTTVIAEAAGRVVYRDAVPTAVPASGAVAEAAGVR